MRRVVFQYIDNVFFTYSAEHSDTWKHGVSDTPSTNENSAFGAEWNIFFSFGKKKNKRHRATFQRPHASAIFFPFINSSNVHFDDIKNLQHFCVTTFLKKRFELVFVSLCVWELGVGHLVFKKCHVSCPPTTEKSHTNEQVELHTQILPKFHYDNEQKFCFVFWRAVEEFLLSSPHPKSLCPFLKAIDKGFCKQVKRTSVRRVGSSPLRER